MRTYHRSDRLISLIDRALKVIAVPPRASRQPNGVDWQSSSSDENLSQDERKLSARLMRVNHSGEMAAQGLYHGQEFAARRTAIARRMKEAAHEEADHLAWCQRRTEELGGHISLLSPLWYLGAFAIGACAGMFGDRISLSFVRETEEQVVRHLDSHLRKISPRDKKTIGIIRQIKADEAEHAQTASKLSRGKQLSPIIQSMMRFSAKIMTTSSHYL